jgi:MtrB/PioB family decaheme-associated outer membrane protein
LEIVMKAPKHYVKIGTLAAAVQGALLAMTAMPVLAAEEPDVAALTTPDNYVEVGVAGVDKTAPKFGEYTGLRRDGAYFIGNFGIKGGDYGSETGVTRWGVSGSNLGLDSRELNGEYSQQGRWSVGVGYDELRHSTTTGYQTPYNGSMGGNSFTLPAGFGTTSNTVTSLSAAQRGVFHTVDIDNTRKNTMLNGSYTFSPQWRITFDYNNLEQSGAKLMGFGSDAHPNGTNTGERIAILPNPTNYTTDTVNIAVDWIGEKGHLTGSYFGSYFRDHYDSVTWTTFAGLNVTDTMSTPPSNQLHQFSLTGGYKLTNTTKLTGGLSYGRNTQDSGFVDGTSMASANGLMLTAAPATSLNGLVITEHADAKLTNQTTKDLRLAAGFKYDNRDNRTSSNIYNFYAIDGSNFAKYPNTPYSHRKYQIELAGDYRINPDQHLRVAYNHDDMKRSCDNYASVIDTSNPAQKILYQPGTNCVVDTRTKEDKLSIGYKLKASDKVDLNAGYTYADRKTDYDQNAIVAMIGVRGGTIISPITGAQGTIRGLNGGDYQGFHPLFDASRKQQVLKGGVDFQATEQFSLGVNGRYTDDNYEDNPYGAQNGKSWNLNLDATYNYSDNGSIFAYISQDYRDRSINHVNRSNSTSSAYLWSDKLKDQATTYGIGFKQGGLVGGKLDLKGDLSYSDAKSNYSSALYYTFLPGGTTTSTTCAAAATLTCGSAPDIANKLTQFKLVGTYKVDKNSKVALGYIYQKLSSTDYFYNGYQYLYTPTGVMPTNQQSGSYSVNVVAASYIYSFK